MQGGIGFSVCRPIGKVHANKLKRRFIIISFFNGYKLAYANYSNVIQGGFQV